MSRRTHTPPFRAPDWPLVLESLPLQPVPLWIACSLALHPIARATPLLLNASCRGNLREGVVDMAFIVESLVLPPSTAALVYLLAGRRRMTEPLRRLGDWSLALVLLIGAVNGADLARNAAAGWSRLGPGLTALRAACWK